MITAIGLLVLSMGLFWLHNMVVDKYYGSKATGCSYEQGQLVMLGAKAYINSGLTYSDKYYGGYPPAHVGVCTDVVWRGLKAINVTFKDLIDEDTKENFDEYEDIISYRDTGLDFRYVPVVKRYLERNAVSLSTDPGNILAWQPGDIVVYGNDHVAVVSSLTNLFGYPYVIQHGKDPAGDEDRLFGSDKLKISAHFRWNQTIIMGE
ncbi:DUF1287 domain-containing protein [Aminicella lysinilytica]|uniref:DUF1287 domain-containing protein n=1 Tax=Aminicella lysinilytica TaxID=433323 RepID=UPI0014151980|nr:DUF1287 domain-containing protein [Aminicella lysinilytica]NLD11479.1 DUF1287 domain-containing protein [Clostridiales bacterium]